MSWLRAIADRLADRIGGPRMPALLLLRALGSAPGEGTTFVLTFRRARPGDLA